MKKAILFLLVSVCIISFNLPAYAVHSNQENLVFSKKDIEQELGRKLTLKEVIGLGILQKTLKKAAKKKRKGKFSAPDECGEISLKSGEQLQVHIKQLTATDITYTLCDDASQKTITTALSNINTIRSAEGFLVYEHQVYSQDDTIYDVGSRRKKTDTFAILSFIFSLTIYLVPVAFVFGLVSLKRIKKYPDLYKGKTFALIGTILSGVLLLLYLILFILLLGFIL